MYILDSSILIEIINNTKRAELIHNTIGNLPVVTTSICLHEILSGNFNKQEKFIMENILSNIETLPHTQEAAQIGAEIFKELKEKGNNINEFDILIAGICKANNATLITLDKDFAKINNLNAKIL